MITLRVRYCYVQSLTSLVSPEITCHHHSIIACSRHIYVWCCSSGTSRSWWITHLTQHHRRSCNKTNLKGYFLKCFPVHFCRLRLHTMSKNENCECKAQVAKTKFACQKSAMKKFAPQLRTCSFADYLSQTPSTGIHKWNYESECEIMDGVKMEPLLLNK